MIKKIASVICLGLGLSLVAHAQGDATAGQAMAGQCAGCHGADGNSMAPTFPKLAGQNARYMVKQLKDFASGDRVDAGGMMPGMVAGKTDQDFDNLAAFFGKQAMTTGQAKADQVDKGAKLYRGGNLKTGVAACASCHGPKGDGMAAAGFPRLGGQHADYIVTQLKAFRAAGRNDLDGANRRTNDAAKKGELGMMQAIAAKLSDEEIQTVAQFIQGLY